MGYAKIITGRGTGRPRAPMRLKVLLKHTQSGTWSSFQHQMCSDALPRSWSRGNEPYGPLHEGEGTLKGHHGLGRASSVTTSTLDSSDGDAGPARLPLSRGLSSRHHSFLKGLGCELHVCVCARAYETEKREAKNPPEEARWGPAACAPGYVSGLSVPALWAGAFWAAG